MYIPRHHHWFFPTALVLAGFYIHEHVNPAWDVIVFVNVPLALIAVEWGAYIWQAGVAYQMYITRGAAPAKTDVPEIEPTFTPIVRPIIHDNAQVVELVTFDEERHFAIDMLRMYDFDPITQRHVNATETLWVKTKKKFSQGKLKNLKEKWYHFGLFKRENANKNARYIVADRRKIALVAEGNPLPAWTPPPPEE